MTPAEIIAVRLLGWEPISVEDIGYPHSKAYRSIDDRFYRNENIDEIFPAFDDEVDKWYFIRRMEDALAERGLIWQYFNALNALCSESPRCLRATAEQRVQAAMRVLEEGA
jgi:hypothetical protein